MLLRALVKVMSHVVSAEGPLTVGKGSQRAIIALMLAALACYLYFPNFTPDIWDAEEVTKTPIGIVKQRIANEYDTEREQVYSTKEREFVQKAASLIPRVACAESAHDGSVFAYGLDGLNTYFRSAGTFGYSDTAETIRQGADKIATDKGRSRRCEKVRAPNTSSCSTRVSPTKTANGSRPTMTATSLLDGLNKVTDETPGYELILADGDMRLYKITATEDDEARKLAPMWPLFAGACLACLLALYGPGCLLFRGLRFSWPLALACAPLASVFGYAAISVLWAYSA